MSSEMDVDEMTDPDIPTGGSNASNSLSTSPEPGLSYDETFCPQVFVWLQIEQTVFKICRADLEGPSPVLGDLFKSADAGAGISAAKPLKLRDVNVGEFKAFMMFLTEKLITWQRHAYSIMHLISILKLSTRWRITGLRTMAITWLTPRLKSGEMWLDLIKLGHDYYVGDWLLLAVEALAQREATLTDKEFTILGPEIGLKVIEVRARFTLRCGGDCKKGKQPTLSMADAVRSGSHCKKCLVILRRKSAVSLDVSRRDYSFKEDIKEVFGLR